LGKWINQYKQDADLWQVDEYKKLFDKCTAAINKFWSGEINEFMKKHHPDLAREIDESEKRLDELWGNVPLAEYRQELVKFYKLYEQACKNYEEK